MPISRQQLDDVIERLAAWFPKTFYVYQGFRKPLKVGITRDLEMAIVQTTERRLLRLAMAYYVRELGYQLSLRAGADRINLDGNAAGVVTEKQAEQAKAVVAAIKAKRRKPAPKPPPRRDGLSALREAARRRREAAATAAGGGA